MTRTYSDDEYADALLAESWERFVKTARAAIDDYIEELDYASVGTDPPELHRNHIHHRVYGPGELLEHGCP